MGRFLRSKRLRNALWVAAGGKCPACGQPLPDDWHADHIDPWCVTGRTNVFEMQALCPACNAQKGAKVSLQDCCKAAEGYLDQIDAWASLMRRHQKLTSNLSREVVRGLAGGRWPDLVNPNFVTLEVVPGGGKSYSGVMAASVFVGSGLYDRALWVVPRKSLRRQATDDFVSLSFQMPATGRAFNPFNPAGLRAHVMDTKKLFDPSRQVFVTTYQSATAHADVLLHFAEAHRVLLILDESQLLSDKEDKGWVASCNPVIEACMRKSRFAGIILSGGLYRNDNDRLAHVRYRNGDPCRGEDENRQYALADIRYTLAEAQEDRSIIKIDFDLYDGEVGFENDEGPGRERLAGLTPKQYGRKLRHWLDEDEVWQPIWGDALDSLDSYNRERSYQSRYLGIAHSISAAEAQASWLRARGRNPLLVHSGLTNPHDDLDFFRRGQGDWDGLLTVGMAYIGLSYKPFSHLVYLSHIRSMAWINQAFHRVTRFDNARNAPPYELQFARICGPNDRWLVEIATGILASQSPGVRDSDIVCGPRGPNQGHLFDDFEGQDASILGRQFNTNGVPCTESEFIEHAVRKLPVLNSLQRKAVEDFYSLTKDYREQAGPQDGGTQE